MSFIGPPGPSGSTLSCRDIANLNVIFMALVKSFPMLRWFALSLGHSQCIVAYEPISRCGSLFRIYFDGADLDVFVWPRYGKAETVRGTLMSTWNIADPKFEIKKVVRVMRRRLYPEIWYWRVVGGSILRKAK